MLEKIGYQTHRFRQITNRTRHHPWQCAGMLPCSPYLLLASANSGFLLVDLDVNDVGAEAGALSLVSRCGVGHLRAKPAAAWNKSSRAAFLSLSEEGCHVQ